jgi:ParB/RepB/Spo0J family partition protein
MKINLRLAEPNPSRDFRIDPVDPAAVVEIGKSIKQYDYFGGIVARRKPGARPVIYQIIAGETRRRAALKQGIEEADVYVGDFDDEEVVRIYAIENATQRGNHATAVAGAVAAAFRQILLRELMSGQNVQTSRRPESDGVGRDAILKELHDIPGITERIVRDQLANLKSSGDYDRIVREVTTVVEAEQAAELEALREAEEAREAAGRRAAEAKAAREKAEAEKRAAREESQRRDAAAKAERDATAKKEAQRRATEAQRKAEEAEKRRKLAAEEDERAKAASKAAKEREAKHAPAAQTRDAVAKARAEPKHDRTFDLAGISRHFKAASHVEAFRKLALKHADLLPVSEQAGLAKRIVEAAKDSPHGEVSAQFIDEEFVGLIKMEQALKRDLDAKDRKAREHELAIRAWSEKAKALQENFRKYSASVIVAVGNLVELEKSRPDGAEILVTPGFVSGVAHLRNALKHIEQDLGYRDAKSAAPEKASHLRLMTE